tara:strand:- start:3130 stop:4539 length:1410 start_codon:yes stop_codon:yes gene_type:complete
MKISKTCWILTIAIFFGLLAPTLVQDGMFLDGITYSAISNNMSNGIGDFWNPHYTKTLANNFHGHPPLVFGIQSLLFKLLGGHIYTERIYTLLTAILTAIGMILCWQIHLKHNSLKKLSWLPILLWITIPINFWAYKNNLLENTLGVFTIFSIYFISKSFYEKRIIWILISSIFIVMAFLSKGFVGLFPLATPFFFILIFKPKPLYSSILYYGIILFFTLFLFYTIAVLLPESGENIHSYLVTQVIPALNNKLEITTENRFSILLNLILELTVPILLLLYVVVTKWRKNQNFKFHHLRNSIYFLLIGVSASLPLIITLKQRSFYFVPSLPFYMLSIAFLISPFLKEKLEKLTKGTIQLIKGISLISLSGVLFISIFNFGKFSRDEDKLRDIYTISNFIPKGTVISTTENLWNDWSLHAYMSRIGFLSLDCDEKNEYFLIEKGIKDNIQLKGFQDINLKLNQYIILKRRK